MSKHTPAPWILGKSEGGERLILGPATQPFHATIVAKVMTGNIADDWIIQHAPDLLAALERWVTEQGDDWHDVPQCGMTPPCLACDIRAAVSKAGGRSIAKARPVNAPAPGESNEPAPGA